MLKSMFFLSLIFVFATQADARDLGAHQFEDGSYFNDDYMYEESIINNVRVETPSDVYVPEVEQIKPLPVARKPLRTKRPARRPSSNLFHEVKTNRSQGGDFRDVTLDSDYYENDSISYGQK